MFLRGKAANAFHVYQVITWFSVRRHCQGGAHTCLLLSGAFTSWWWSVECRTEKPQRSNTSIYLPNLPEAAVLPSGWGCFLMLAGGPSVAVTTQLRLLEQKSRALMALLQLKSPGMGLASGSAGPVVRKLPLFPPVSFARASFSG